MKERKKGRKKGGSEGRWINLTKYALFFLKKAINWMLVKPHHKSAGPDSGPNFGTIVASHFFLWTLDYYLQNDIFNNMISRVSPALFHLVYMTSFKQSNHLPIFTYWEIWHENLISALKKKQKQRIRGHSQIYVKVFP